MHYKNNPSRSFAQILSLKLTQKIQDTTRMYPRATGHRSCFFIQPAMEAKKSVQVA